MKIASHVLAYNVTSTLGACIENMAPHIDKIFIAYPSRPWGYNEQARASHSNPTTMSDVIDAAGSRNVEIVEGDWNTEEETRNTCLQRARAQGFDWMLTQDADEFYTREAWENIRAALARDNGRDCYKTTWYNFWKSAQYVLVNGHGDIKGTNACFAIRCKSDIVFARLRRPSTNEVHTLDCPCYHYGYVRTDEEIRTKISTWAHTADFDVAGWYSCKWQNWQESTRNLNPTHPYAWKQAIRFPLEQPPFALEYFDLPLPPVAQLSSRAVIADLLFDARIDALHAAKGVKRFVLNLNQRKQSG
jgi:hypothetical protein